MRGCGECAGVQSAHRLRQAGPRHRIGGLSQPANSGPAAQESRRRDACAQGHSFFVYSLGTYRYLPLNPSSFVPTYRMKLF